MEGIRKCEEREGSEREVRNEERKREGDWEQGQEGDREGNHA